MQLEKGSYVLIGGQGSKKVTLAKITKTSPLAAVVVDKRMVNKNTAVYVTLESSDIVANFGTKPKFGSAYGVNIEPCYGAIEIEPFGNVILFRQINEDTQKRLRKKLTFLGNKLKKEKLFPKKDFEVTIREHKGQWLGYWKHHKKGDVPDEMCFRPEIFEDLDYLISHEMGHGLWFHNMPQGFRAKWISKYNAQVKLSQISAKELDQLRQGLLSSEYVSDFIKNLDDEDKLVAKEVLRYIRHNNSLDKYDLEDLIQSGNDLKEIWPKAVDISKKGVLISEYAMTNAKEFWAEAFAFEYIKKGIPKSLRKLMRRTLAAIKANDEAEE